MALKNRRTQKNKTNRRKQQSKRGGKRIGKNTKKNLRNKRQSRRRGGGRGYRTIEAWQLANKQHFREQVTLEIDQQLKTDPNISDEALKTIVIKNVYIADESGMDKNEIVDELIAKAKARPSSWWPSFGSKV